MSGRTIVTAGAILLLLFLGYNALGGSVTATEPSNVPAVSVPDAGQAADGALNAANSGADYIAGLSQSAWTIIVLLLATGAVIYVFRRNQWLRWVTLGAGIVGVLMIATGVWSF